MHPANLSPDTHTAEDVARQLQLEPLEPEGGYFRRTHEGEVIPGGDGRRTFSVIYFLVTPRGFSALHRLDADETWCFHAGDALESLRLAPGGGGRWVRMGADAAAGERLQDVVPAGEWQGTRLRPGGRWALVSCLVVPEFRWEGFELGDRAALSARHPEFAADIAALTR
jgi:predicted cupin superfamily sugar epimerase